MKVLLWTRFVGGPFDGEDVPSNMLMIEGPIETPGTTYGKRKMVILEQSILVLADAKMTTEEVSVALLRSALRSHPAATDEEPNPVDEALGRRHEELCDRGDELRRREVGQ